VIRDGGRASEPVPLWIQYNNKKVCMSIRKTTYKMKKEEKGDSLQSMDAIDIITIISKEKES